MQQKPAVIHHVLLCSMLCSGQLRNECNPLISAFSEATGLSFRILSVEQTTIPPPVIYAYLPVHFADYSADQMAICSFFPGILLTKRWVRVMYRYYDNVSHLHTAGNWSQISQISTKTISKPTLKCGLMHYYQNGSSFARIGPSWVSLALFPGLSGNLI